MGFGLRAGVSYCEVAGRLLFLDVRRDRYFCLSEASEAAFRRVAQGAEAAAPDAAALAGMIGDGLLVPGAPPRRCPPVPQPQRSVVDALEGVSSSVATLGAIAGLVRARAALRLLGLARTLARLPPAIGTPSEAEQEANTIQVAAAYQQAGLLVTALDRCLPRSIAVADRCRRLGIPVDLILGVRLQPFAAHCWVQLGATIVNDRLDKIRNFTPILVQ
ncbi:lasso peptide biosynthesis B2 protein [Sphingomonas koreensis]|uniref:lasso peptide biosynthesis B2 protein n=1 Tax=Sphingomonas koreensis TaxID=93064 RepID=UPI00234ED2C2|nr:lasso peptide biosynthesis B2 protein [Sphingomonas koreensis]MDC7810149.1 lasso peptide biosynthesis B2 protein [Sphingomonas koreensis]